MLWQQFHRRQQVQMPERLEMGNRCPRHWECKVRRQLPVLILVYSFGKLFFFFACIKRRVTGIALIKVRWFEQSTYRAERNRNANKTFGKGEKGRWSYTLDTCGAQTRETDYWRYKN